MALNRKIQVEGKEITVILDNNQEYISLTDMLKAKYGEFAIIKSQAGLNSYKLSAKEWVQKPKQYNAKAKMMFNEPALAVQKS